MKICHTFLIFFKELLSVLQKLLFIYLEHKTLHMASYLRLTDVFILRVRGKRDRQETEGYMQRERKRTHLGISRAWQISSSCCGGEREKVWSGRERKAKKGDKQRWTEKQVKQRGRNFSSREQKAHWSDLSVSGGEWKMEEEVGGGKNSKRKRDSIKPCQGQFAVNRPLHLAALSLRGCMLLRASWRCLLGGARPL